MKFFQDGKGNLHSGRIGGVLYIAGLILVCGAQVSEPRWRAQAVFTLGWWLAFGAKELPRTLAELARRPLCFVGAGLIVAGLAGQFQFARNEFSVSMFVLPLLIGAFSYGGGFLYRRYR